MIGRVGRSFFGGGEGEVCGLKWTMGQSGSRCFESHENLVSQLKTTIREARNDSLLQGDEQLKSIMMHVASTSTDDFS